MGDVASVDELRVAVSDMRRLLRVALGSGGSEELVATINLLAEHSGEIERAVVVWVDLVEALVQSAEQAYGSRPGRGRVKAAEVEEVIRRLLGRSGIKIPNVPDVLRPMILDIAAGWIVDAVVHLTNRYGTWVDVEPAPRTIRSRILLWLRKLGHLLRPVVAPLAWLVSRVWAWFSVPAPLSPPVRAALAAVEREGLVGQTGELLRGVEEFFVWIGTHRAQVLASLDLVFAAVHQAESYLSLTGPEKKQYAHDLLLAVLDDVGLDMRAGVLVTTIESLADGAIEASVHLFNKRGVFEHASVGAGAE